MEILFTEEEIQKKVDEIAAILNKEFKGKDPLIIGIMTGAFIFCADLIRKLDFSFEFEFMFAKSYLNSTVSSGNVQIKPIDFDVKGRDVILIDDILDTGNTLDALLKKLAEDGAKSVTSVVLFDKPCNREKNVKADIAGFEVDDDFLVGYGMDDDVNRGRHFPYVGKLDK